jgi:hypothetical protein
MNTFSCHRPFAIAADFQSAQFLTFVTGKNREPVPVSAAFLSGLLSFHTPQHHRSPRQASPRFTGFKIAVWPLLICSLWGQAEQNYVASQLRRSKLLSGRLENDDEAVHRLSWL